jgi:hypothetical protein|tara:strand:- start:79 stop:918 length:840 start_codon:yes stop_codon:yes gene_type:complete
MTEQVEEPKANPYNKEKSWHTPDAPNKGDATSLFFDDSKQATSEEAPVEEETKKEKTNYKKRYDDLKKHYDEKVADFKQKELELLAKAEETKVELPKLRSPEDLEQFKNKYPDLFETVETVAYLKSEEKTKALEAKLQALQEREANIVRKEAEESLRDKHPDFEDIKGDDDFHAWANEQPEQIQGWIYNNPDNVALAIKAIDLYKLETGKGVKAPSKRTKSKSQSSSSAADMISTRTTSIESKEPKVWTRKEIASLSMADYDKYEQEIDQAVMEGRVVS